MHADKLHTVTKAVIENNTIPALEVGLLQDKRLVLDKSCVGRVGVLAPVLAFTALLFVLCLCIFVRMHACLCVSACFLGLFFCLRLIPGCQGWQEEESRWIPARPPPGTFLSSLSVCLPPFFPWGAPGSGCLRNTVFWLVVGLPAILQEPGLVGWTSPRGLKKIKLAF